MPDSPVIPTLDLEALIDPVSQIARQAAAAILPFYKSDMDVDKKDDWSPVTEADFAADRVIVPALEALTPDIPVVSEERRASHVRSECFWLVDPLDGTKEFINERDEFTVNIGLVFGDRPVFGVLGVPVKDTVYAAAGPGTATRQTGDGPRQTIGARIAPADGIVVTASRSHAKREELDTFLADEKVADRIIAGSALKFALVAEGAADLYPRFGATMEWDTAAGQAIVEAAGGVMRTLEGDMFRYGKKNFRNKGFVVRGRPEGA